MTINKQAKREAKQLFRLCLVNGLLDENRVRKVAQRIGTSQKRNCPAILAHFLRLVRLDLEQHTASVESAVALPADLQVTVESGLQRRYGSTLATTFAQRSSLIGGMRIQVGFDVYDGSVLASLQALEQSF